MLPERHLPDCATIAERKAPARRRARRVTATAVRGRQRPSARCDLVFQKNDACRRVFSHGDRWKRQERRKRLQKRENPARPRGPAGFRVNSGWHAHGSAWAWELAANMATQSSDHGTQRSVTLRRVQQVLLASAVPAAAG